MLWFLRQFGPRLTQRLIALVVLCGVCLATVPLPQAPAIVGQKDHSKPFPCQDRPCGCRTADQCWKKCCCFTNVEKVAWAKTHDVELPAFVLAAAKKETETSVVSAVCQAGTNCGTCHDTKAPRREAASSCCRPAGETPVAVSEKTPSARPPVPAKRSSRWVLGVAAEQCRGEHGTISSLPVSIAAPRFRLEQPVATVGTVALPASEVACGLCRLPAVPPPRRLAFA